VSAKELTALILDEERLRAERKDRKSWKSRVSGIDDFDPDIGPGPAPKVTPKKPKGRERTEEEDLEYRLAIEASKNEAEEDARRRASRAGNADEDDDLAKAIKLSKEEEELRKRELEEANANSLFDDTPAPAASQPTGWNQGYQQQPSVDWFGNVIDAQAPQQTGYLAQPAGFANGGYGYGGMQPQMTGYLPQQIQPQQTAFNMNNPYSQQNGLGYGQQPQQEPGPSPGTNNPWASKNTNLAADPQIAQPTGSNNPFASKISQPINHAQRLPTLNTLQEQKATSAFNPIMNFQPQPGQIHSEPVSRLSPQPQQQYQQPQLQLQNNKPLGPMHAKLNELLSAGEGLDSFGNVGDLRIPAQHTAPGTFVNSAGANLNRLTQNQTGNPFLNSQFTGMPQTNRMQPAATGPVGGFGASYGQNTNPFGAGQQGGRPPGQSGNLIDL
jgi:epsin